MQAVDKVLRRFGVETPSPPDALEEFLYALAATELQEDNERPGLMARAFADADGDEAKSQALYLRMRVSQLRREYDAAVATHRLAEEKRATEVREASIYADSTNKVNKAANNM